MNKLQKIKDEIAVDHGYSNWDNFMSYLHKAPRHNPESYYDKAARIYAQQACEDLRERITEEVQFNCNDIYTIKSEIVLP